MDALGSVRWLLEWCFGVLSLGRALRCFGFWYGALDFGKAFRRLMHRLSLAPVDFNQCGSVASSRGLWRLELEAATHC